jgi:hypothetical protein
MQKDEPVLRQERNNWLPTTKRDSHPILRMDEPDDTAFAGGYKLPPVSKRP